MTATNADGTCALPTGMTPTALSHKLPNSLPSSQTLIGHGVYGKTIPFLGPLNVKWEMVYSLGVYVDTEEFRSVGTGDVMDTIIDGKVDWSRIIMKTTSDPFGPDNFDHNETNLVVPTGGTYVEVALTIVYGCIEPGAGNECQISVSHENWCSGRSCGPSSMAGNAPPLRANTTA